MGTKKQTLRNRLMAFAVVMVYALALLPSFALAAISDLPITSVALKNGNGGVQATINEFSFDNTIETPQEIVLPKGTSYLAITPTYKDATVTNLATTTVLDGQAITPNGDGAFVITGIGTTAKELTIDTQISAGGSTYGKSVFSIRQAKSIVTLDSFAVTAKSGETALEAFDPAIDDTTAAHALTVPNANTELNITAPVTAQSNATVKVTNNDAAVADLTKTALVVGLNKIDIVVTAEDGETTFTKTLNVTRTAADKTNTLNSLSVKGNETDAKEKIVFNPNSTKYDVTLDEKATQFTIDAKLPDGSKSKIDGAVVGTPTVYTKTVTVVPGTTGIYTVTVKPEDSSYSNTTYTINVTAPGKKDDASLKELSLKQDDGRALAFSPKFDTNTTKYTADIANMTTKFWVKQDILSDKDATVTYHFDGSASPASSTEKTDKDGVKYDEITIPTTNAFVLGIKVTAADGQTTKIYNVSVTRLPKSNDASVKNITFSGAWTKENFSEGTTSYTGVSAGTTAEIIVNTNHPFAQLSILDENDSSMGSYTIVNGVASTVPTTGKIFKIQVKAEDGSGAKTYSYLIEQSRELVKPANPKVTATTETTATFSYVAPKGMDKVAAYYKPTNDANAKWICGGIVNANAGKITAKNLQPNTNYTFILTAGKEIYSGKMSYIPLAQLTNDMVLATTKSLNTVDGAKVLSTDESNITVAYNAVSGAESYALYVKENGGKTWTYAAKTGAKGGALTAKNLDSKKKYDVVVTSGKMINGKMTYIPLASLYNPNNTALNGIALNTTKLPNNVETTNQVVAGDKLVVTYTGVTGYDNYALYVADKADGTYKYAAVTSNPNEIIASGLEAGKTYYYKLTIGKNVNGKMTYTPLAEIKDIITVVVPK